MTKKHIYYRFFDWLARTVFFKPRTLQYDVVPPQDEVAVFVPNHLGAAGPSNMVLYFDRPARPWIISYLNDKEIAPNYIFHNFLLGRTKKHKWVYRFLSRLCRAMLVPLLRANNPIWVNNTASGTIKSFRDSVDALQEGNNILIFAENNKHCSSYINCLNDGFVEVGLFYYKSTGKKLKFYPVYIPDGLSVIRIGTPTEYEPDNKKGERQRIATYLQDNITAMAEALPPHNKPQFVSEDFYKYYGDVADDDKKYFELVAQKHSD